MPNYVFFVISNYSSTSVYYPVQIKQSFPSILPSLLFSLLLFSLTHPYFFHPCTVPHLFLLHPPFFMLFFLYFLLKICIKCSFLVNVKVSFMHTSLLVLLDLEGLKQSSEFRHAKETYVDVKHTTAMV